MLEKGTGVSNGHLVRSTEYWRKRDSDLVDGLKVQRSERSFLSRVVDSVQLTHRDCHYRGEMIGRHDRLRGESDATSSFPKLSSLTFLLREPLENLDRDIYVALCSPLIDRDLHDLQPVSPCLAPPGSRFCTVLTVRGIPYTQMNCYSLSQRCLGTYLLASRWQRCDSPCRHDPLASLRSLQHATRNMQMQCPGVAANTVLIVLIQCTSRSRQRHNVQSESMFSVCNCCHFSKNEKKDATTS